VRTYTLSPAIKYSSFDLSNDYFAILAVLDKDLSIYTGGKNIKIDIFIDNKLIIFIVKNKNLLK
jgi:hypothetical protein